MRAWLRPAQPTCLKRLALVVLEEFLRLLWRGVRQQCHGRLAGVSLVQGRPTTALQLQSKEKQKFHSSNGVGLLGCKAM